MLSLGSKPIKEGEGLGELGEATEDAAVEKLTAWETILLERDQAVGSGSPNSMMGNNNPGLPELWIQRLRLDKQICM